MADSPEKKKRKRDVKQVDEGINEARITYHTPFKTFERLFNEASLDDTKRVIRAKIGLEPNVGMELAQLRGESRIVLEDEDDFRAFCVALRANPQVDVQVTIADALHSDATRAQDAEIKAPATKKRKTKQSIAPTPSNPTAVAAYATPAYSTSHPSAAFSTSSIASLPPSSASHSPGTITSPLLAFPSLPAPFTTPASIPVAAVRTLPPATGVLGPTPTPKGSGKDKKKDKASEKADRSAVKETDEEDEEKEEKKEKKEKPKRVRKKSEAASAPAAPMSPAAREKAAAILERHRQAIAERAKAPPRKRTKKADVEAGVKEPTKDPVVAPKAVEKAPIGGDQDVEQDEESDKPKKEKRKKKKKKQAAEEEDEREERGVEDDDLEPAREESPPKTARRESPSKEKKGKKRKDKEMSSPNRASSPPGTLTGEGDGEGVVDVNMENGLEETEEITRLDERPKGKSKIPTVAPNAKVFPVVRRPADASAILNAGKGDKSIIVSPAVLATVPAQIKPPSTSPVKQAASITSAKSPPPPAPNRAVCPICLEPFHLRFKCPLLQTRGPAIHRRLAELDRTGHAKLVGELRGWLETEKKRDQLRALGKPGNSGTMGKNGQGGRAVVVLDGDSDERGDGGERGLKKRIMSFESEERDEPEEDEEKKLESDFLGDPDATEDEEDDDDDDDDGRADSVPASLGRPTMSKPSLVSVEKPGEGSEMTSSDSEDDDEMEPIAHNEDDDEDEDEEMDDTSRAPTPQAPYGKQGEEQKTSSSSSSSSTRFDSPFPSTKRKADTSQNKPTKLPSAARSPRSFRGINDEPEDGATDAVHQRMQRDTAQVLIPNSDDSVDKEMAELEANNNAQEEDEYHGKPHTPNASDSRGSMDRLFQNRGSPVARGRTPGTPVRIQAMKDRHGNTAPVQRTYGDDGVNGGEYSPPSAHPFPNHKLQSASQSSNLPSRMPPRLSGFSMANVRDAAINLFKGAPAASSPTAQGPPTSISVPPSGRVLNGTAGKDFQDESTSSSSTDSDSKSSRDAPRVPKGRKAGATLAMPPKKSVLALM